MMENMCIPNIRLGIALILLVAIFVTHVSCFSDDIDDEEVPAFKQPKNKKELFEFYNKPGSPGHFPENSNTILEKDRSSDSFQAQNNTGTKESKDEGEDYLEEEDEVMDHEVEVTEEDVNFDKEFAFRGVDDCYFKQKWYNHTV